MSNLFFFEDCGGSTIKKFVVSEIPYQIQSILIGFNKKLHKPRWIVVVVVCVEDTRFVFESMPLSPGTAKNFAESLRGFFLKLDVKIREAFPGVESTITLHDDV